MLLDFEEFLFDYLVNPTFADVVNVLRKYKITSSAPIFEQRANTCLEVRQMSVEQLYGRVTRLPARFEFDSQDHAKLFIELLSLQWDKIREESVAA